MSTAAATTVKIEAIWSEWNYFRTEGQPYWDETYRQTLEARVCPRSYIVTYKSQSGSERRVVLPRFRRREDIPKDHWRESYGKHERMSYRKIEYALL